jgi:polysaccharide deacetylase family protein (PEP-CTERM system associated)
VHHFLITIDVEDWFQVENLRPWNPVSTWDSRELRVEANVYRLLDLFDEVQLEARSSNPEAKDGPPPCARNRAAPFLKNPENSVNPVGLHFAPAPCAVRRAPSSPVRCTFFVLGWIAERLPHLVREIAARGHEVASHGSSHRMCNRLDDAELRDELGSSKRLLEDITGARVAGFRAPNFSVDDRVLALIRECGYEYDSSYNSFGMHGRYGRISLNGDRMGIAHRVADDFFELPVSNLDLEDFIGARCKAHGARQSTRWALPWSGGAYFRLMPLGLFQRGVRSILNRDGVYLFYMHPWEIDPGQPRVRQASMSARFKHYTNLVKTEDKLRKMIEKFGDCCFTTCQDYLNDKKGSDRIYRMDRILSRSPDESWKTPSPSARPCSTL